MRGRYEGAWNVVRFNWPKYISGLCVILVTFTCSKYFPDHKILWVALGLIATSMVVLPLMVSHIIYDRSPLYHMPWLREAMETGPQRILNLNAGFDESSAILQRRFPRSELTVVDLYDPHLFTESSIARARRAYPPYPGTVAANHGALPTQAVSTDLAIAFHSLHEVRTHTGRVELLKEIRRTLTRDGHLIVTEHLRDVPNTLAFSIGVFHFHTRKSWISAFHEAGFRVAGTHRTAGFITTFILLPA